MRKDERAVEWDGREMKRNGWRIMWVEKAKEEDECVKEEEQEEGQSRSNAKSKREESAEKLVCWKHGSRENVCKETSEPPL